MKDQYVSFNGRVYKYDGLKFSVPTGTGDTPLDTPMHTQGLLLTDEVERRVKYIQGKVLTVIDAVLSDKEQKKATKDIINQIISHELNSLSDSGTGFHTLTEGDMIQFSGSEDKFMEDNVAPVMVSA